MKRRISLKTVAKFQGMRPVGVELTLIEESFGLGSAQQKGQDVLVQQVDCQGHKSTKYYNIIFNIILKVF